MSRHERTEARRHEGEKRLHESPQASSLKPQAGDERHEGTKAPRHNVEGGPQDDPQAASLKPQATSGLGLFVLLKRAALEFLHDDAITLSAGVAFYTALSFAPLMLLVITVGGLLGGERKNELVAFIEHQMSPQAAHIAEMVVDEAERQQLNQSGARWRWIVSIGMLFFTASAVFAQLQHALNRVWNVALHPGKDPLGWFRKRLLSLIMIVTILLILVATLVVSTMLNHLIPAGIAWGPRVLANIISLGLLTLLFAAAFKILPDAHIAWTHVWVGAVVTAGLFAVGTFLISEFLKYGTFAAGYDKATGTFLALLIWVYYSSIIFFFGAEVTEQVAHARGRSIKPKRFARVTTEQER
jgi:membrane protein